MASRLFRHLGWRFYGADGSDKDNFGVAIGGGGGITELTGNVTAGPGSGSQVATIANAAVSNAKLADMAAWTFKIRNAGTSGVPSDAAVGDLTASTPVAADFVLGYKADGTIRKYAASDFGVTGGGTVVASMGRTFAFMGA